MKLSFYEVFPRYFFLSSSLQSVSKIIVPSFTENDDCTCVLPCRKWNCMPQWILSSFHPLMREIVCRQMKLNCKLCWLQQQVPFVQTPREPLNCQKDLTLPDTVASDNIFMVPAPHIVPAPTIYDFIYNITGKMAKRSWINCKWNSYTFWFLGCIRAAHSKMTKEEIKLKKKKKSGEQ